MKCVSQFFWIPIRCTCSESRNHLNHRSDIETSIQSAPGVTCSLRISNNRANGRRLVTQVWTISCNFQPISIEFNSNYTREKKTISVRHFNEMKCWLLISGHLISDECVFAHWFVYVAHVRLINHVQLHKLHVSWPSLYGHLWFFCVVCHSFVYAYELYEVWHCWAYFWQQW